MKSNAGTLDLIKGGGGALLREKVIASSSRRLIIIADDTKLVDWLGAHFAVPVEVVQFEWQATERKLKKLGAQTTLRPGENDAPFVTDSGNFIVDCTFRQIEAPAELDQQLNSVVGVVEHGLFLKMTSQAIVARARRRQGFAAAISTLFSSAIWCIYCTIAAGRGLELWG